MDDAGAPPLLSVLSAPPEREVSFEAVFQALDQAKESQILARLFAADIALYRAMPEPERAMLRSPISVIVGDKDHVVSEHAADAWRTRTSASFSLAVVPGDHFYVRDANCRRFLEREIATRVFTLTQLEKRHIGGTVASPAAPDAAFAASVQATTRYL